MEDDSNLKSQTNKVMFEVTSDPNNFLFFFFSISKKSENILHTNHSYLKYLTKMFYNDSNITFILYSVIKTEVKTLRKIPKYVMS